MTEYYESKIGVKRINSGKLFRRVLALPELPRLLIRFVVNDIRTTEAMRQSRIRDLKKEEDLRLASCGCRLLERRDSGGFILANVEDCVELRHLQEIEHPSGRTKQL